MKVAIFVEKETALRRGSDKWGRMIVEVPAEQLSTDEREWLIAYGNCGSEGSEESKHDYSLIYPSYGSNPIYKGIGKIATEPTAEVVKSLLADIHERDQKEKAEKAEKEKVFLAERENLVAEVLAKDPITFVVPERYKRNVNGEGWQFFESKCPDYGDATNEFRSKVRELVEEKNEGVRREIDAVRAAKEAKQQEGILLLRRWAEQFGSELLQERIKEGFKWTELAEKEWASAQVSELGEEIPDPPGYQFDKNEERTTPTLEEIQALRRFRKLVPSHATVELAWITYESKKDEYDFDGNEPIHRCELAVKVTAPTGREFAFYYSPANTPVVV